MTENIRIALVDKLGREALSHSWDCLLRFKFTYIVTNGFFKIRKHCVLAYYSTNYCLA